jgi:phage-related protein
MAFEIYKMGKLSDRLEEEAYQWVSYQIQETYGLELTKNEYGYEQNVYEVLTKEQIEEIDAYISLHSAENMWHEPYSLTCLNRIVDQWYEEHEPYVYEGDA